MLFMFYACTLINFKRRKLMDNNIIKITEVNKRIDEDINNFKLYVQQKYNKKYTELAYGNIKNAKYDLENYTLYLGDNRTVSNEFLEEDIEVEFTKGKILVIFPKD